MDDTKAHVWALGDLGKVCVFSVWNLVWNDSTGLHVRELLGTSMVTQATLVVLRESLKPFFGGCEKTADFLPISHIHNIYN